MADADSSQISTEVEWQFIEWLFRMDGRLTWDDIDMRIEGAGKKAGYYNKIDFTLSNVAEQVKRRTTISSTI